MTSVTGASGPADPPTPVSIYMFPVGLPPQMDYGVKKLDLGALVPRVGVARLNIMLLT